MMKLMKQNIIATVLALLLVAGTGAGYPLGTQSFPNIDTTNRSQTALQKQVKETITQQAGILPDNSLYPLKKLREQMQISLTQNQENRYQLYVTYAQRRLAEAQLMALQQKKDYALAALRDAEEGLARASKTITEKEKARRDELAALTKKINQLKKQLEQKKRVPPVPASQKNYPPTTTAKRHTK